MRRLPVIAALLFLTACDKGQIVAVDLRDLSAEVAVVLTLDVSGDAVRLSSPFGLNEGRLTFGEPPDWELEDSEQTMVVVAVDESALTELYGDFARRAGRPEIRRAPPPAAPSFDPTAPLDEAWLLVAPGPRTFVVAANAPVGSRQSIDTYPKLQAQLLIRLPVDPEPCAPNGVLRLYPYGPEVDGLLDDVGPARAQQDMLSAHRLDDQTALVGGPGLFVVRRGQRAQRGADTHNGPDIWVPYPLLWPGNQRASVRGIALRPADRDGIRRGVIAVRGFENNTSWVHEIAFGPRGVELVRTVAELPGVALEDIDIDERDVFAAVTEPGRVIVGHLDGSDLRTLTVPGVNKGYVVRWTGQRDTPIAVGADRAVLLSNADLTAWARREVSVVGERSEISELWRWPQRNEVWAAGRRSSVMVRRDRADWDDLTFRLPPRFQACAVPTASLDELRSLRNIDALAGGDGFVYVSQDDCNAVLAIRVQDQCVAVLTPDGGPARAIIQGDGDSKQLRWATFEDGQLLMIGDEGRMLTNLPPN